jgi:hypothetical protein
LVCAQAVQLVAAEVEVFGHCQVAERPQVDVDPGRFAGVAVHREHGGMSA